MSANIYYRQVNPKEQQRLDVGSPSSFLDTLEKAFHTRTPRLSETDLPVLQGMAACWQYGDDSPYQQLIDAIEQLGVIEVWPEY